MIEDRLILTDGGTPTPAPAPNPTPAPAPNPTPAPAPNPTPAPGPGQTLTGLSRLKADLLPLAVVLVVALLLALNGLLLWQSYHPVPGPGPAPTPTPTPAGFQHLGRNFAPALAGALADGFDAAAADLSAGKPVPDAVKDLKATFDAKRRAAFATSVGPSLSALVPEGTEPKDDATRQAFAQAHRDFAAGLRAGK